MNFALLYNTLKYLLPIQILYQVVYRFNRTRLEYRKNIINIAPLRFSKFCSKYNCQFDNSQFRFLNIEAVYKDWNENRFGNLWAYNLNYMDWLFQPDLTVEKGGEWIDKFVDGVDSNTIGLDPYPIALRGINWIKFISLHHHVIDEKRLRRWNESLYNQYCLLDRRLEFHLLGNHLLEDVMSLFIASLYFQNKKFYNKSRKNLRRQLRAQILNDGSHFEQSAMYHCILLDRLLDCYNFSKNNKVFPHQEEFTNELEGTLKKMLGHLESIIYSDGTIPLINDAAYGIAPPPEEIFKYAERLNLTWTSVPLSDSGFRRFKKDRIEGIIDIADIKASYQSGHSHADTFTYELKIDGDPFVVDTGISTYEKNERRQYERSTSAHNTVTINGKDSSEVWSGFRIGNRAKVSIIEDSPTIIRASHDGFGDRYIHKREFHIYEGFDVFDTIPEGCEGISYIHLAPEVEIIGTISCKRIVTDKALIDIEGAERVEIEENFVSTEYNHLRPSKTIKIHFKKKVEYRIVI